MTNNESANKIERRKLSSRFRRRAALMALSEFGLVVGAVAIFFVFLTVRCRSRVQLDIIIRRDLRR
jgi:hypothetical protein